MGKYQNDSALRSDALSTIYIRHGNAPVSNYYSQEPARNTAQYSERRQKHWYHHGNAEPPYPTYRVTPQGSLVSIDAGDNPLPTHRIYTIAPTPNPNATPMAMPLLPGSTLLPENSMPIGIDKQCAPEHDRTLNPVEEPNAPPCATQTHLPKGGSQRQYTEEAPVASGDPSCLPLDGPMPDREADGCATLPSPPEIDETNDMTEPGSDAQGLLQYEKWWYLREVDISVRGEMLTGIPIFVKQDTLRVINGPFSYFIPMARIDYIRTPDGLCALRTEFDERS